MHAPARCLALAASLLFAGSVAHAAPTKTASHHIKKKAVKHPAEVAPADDDAPHADVDRETDPDARAESRRIALESVDASGDITRADDPVKIARRAPASAREWHVAIGPYLWASSVDANVTLGSSSVGAGVDFIPLERHAKYGAELLADVRYGRFVMSGDLMYGAVAITGNAGIGPIMTTITGSASSLLIDGAGGYTVAGDDSSLASLELRGGIRYQRTSVSGELAVEGFSLQSPESVAAGSDALLGARGFLRPLSWLSLSGVFDVGVFGVSNSTWSASVDASVRVISHVQVSLGWRTLTLDRSQVSIVMHGPRAAVQLVF